jgi:ABC-type methionine transport system permease subunit
MKTLILVSITPFLLGNSAGALGALLPLIIGAIIGLGVIIGSIWAIIKFFTNGPS